MVFNKNKQNINNNKNNKPKRAFLPPSTAITKEDPRPRNFKQRLLLEQQKFGLKQNQNNTNNNNKRSSSVASNNNNSTFSTALSNHHHQQQRSSSRRANSVASHASSKATSIGASSTSSAGFNSGLNLTFGNFEFRELFNSKEGKKGGGIRKLYNDLSRAKKEQSRLEDALQTDDGIQVRRESLMTKAMARLDGEKLRDDPKYLQRKLTKRRSQKRKSAREWAKRKEDLQKSIEEAVERRGKTGKKAMMSANRNRRLAQKKAGTSQGRKDAKKRVERNEKRGAKKKTGGGGFQKKR